LTQLDFWNHLVLLVKMSYTS